MPRFFMQQAGLNIDKDFKNIAFSGAHDATAAFVDDLDTSILEMLSATPLPLSEYWEHANATIGPFPEMSIELARSVGAHLEDAEQRGVALRTERDGLAVWSAAP